MEGTLPWPVGAPKGEGDDVCDVVCVKGLTNWLLPDGAGAKGLCTALALPKAIFGGVGAVH